MRRRENIYYVIEALAYLGGVGDPEDVYNKAGELFPQSIIKSYPDAGAFDEAVRKAVDDCLDSAAGKKVFKRNPAGKLVFKEPYARLARRVREGINPRETIRLWWYMGNTEFCAVTDKCVYFFIRRPEPGLNTRKRELGESNFERRMDDDNIRKLRRDNVGSGRGIRRDNLRLA